MNVRTRSYLLTEPAEYLPSTCSEAKARELRGRIKSGHHRDQAAPHKGLLLAAIALVVLPIAAVMITNGWPLDTTLRHFAAAWNCSTARSVGLAPAHRGEPGYWTWLDPDSDGVSCEPWVASAP